MLARAHRGAQPDGSTRSCRSTPSARWRRPRRWRPATSAPLRGCRSRSRTTARSSGLRLTYGCSLMSDFTAELRPQRHSPPEAGGFHRGGHHHAARVRHPADQRGAPVRPHPQPLGPGAHPRRLLRRLGRRCRSGDGAGRARQRRRRLDPHPRRVLRPGGAQAPARAHLRGPGAGRLARSGSTGC